MLRMFVGVTLCVGWGAVSILAQSGAKNGEWPTHSGELGGTKYSPLSRIHRENVENLRVIWTRPGIDPELRAAFPGISIPRNFRTTPLMVDGVGYVSNAVGLVEAFDPATGETHWVQEPLEWTEDWMTSAQSQRGLGYRQGRVFSVRGEYLYALDSKTGKPIPNFGRDGAVFLREDASPLLTQFFYYSAPLVVRDVVVVGSRVSDSPTTKEAPAGDVRAYDVVTGALRWTFHVVPRAGEFGIQTWEDESWRYTGAANLWGHASADEELGYVYLPLSTATNDWYGGHRPGDNLFAESLVCVDVATGKRVWHYQTVHHGLWDYDLSAPPILADINVDGKEIKAVVQVTKQGFTFVFDRVSGEPVWPIEERPVPQSTVPGERTSPTQPFPTKPAPFDRQGVSIDDLIDFTPELRAEAIELVKDYVIGPLFTPHAVTGDESDQTKTGTLMLPGWVGGSNWNGAAFDPDTGMLYVPSITAPDIVTLRKGNPEVTNFAYTVSRRPAEGPRGLPLVKPPYGRITVIDLNTGEHAWMVPNGEGPRSHPALRDLNLPPLGQAGRAAPLLTRDLLFLGEGSPVMLATPPGAGGNAFRAYDKANGKVLWEVELPAGTTGAPMTYVFQDEQYVVVAVGGREHAPELIAFGLGDAVSGGR